MAEIAKTVVPSLATATPCDAHRTNPLVTGEAIAAGDACYIKGSDGRVWRSIGTTLGAAAAKVDGYAILAYSGAGQPITLYHNVLIAYGPSNLTPGTRLFLSGTVAGGLADAASTGGTAAIAVVEKNITDESVPHSSIYAYRSSY